MSAPMLWTDDVVVAAVVGVVVDTVLLALALEETP